MTFIADHRYQAFATLINEYVKDTVSMLLLTNSVVDLASDYTRDDVDDALETAGHPFQNIIRQQEDELASVYGQLHASQARETELHEVLVHLARNDSELLGHLHDNKKIYAIKRLRTISLAGLVAAKNAVNDDRVRDAAEESRPLADWERELLGMPRECSE